MTGLGWTGLGWAGLDGLVAMVCLVVYTVLACIYFSRGRPMRPGHHWRRLAHRGWSVPNAHISSMPCHAMPDLPGLHRNALPCIAIYFNVAVGCHPQPYRVLAVQPTLGASELYTVVLLDIVHPPAYNLIHSHVCDIISSPTEVHNLCT